MKTIVIATDFSENSREAAKFAFHSVKNPDTQFIFLNAYETPHTNAGGLVSSSDVLKKASEENLEKEVAWARKAFGSSKTIAKRAYFGQLQSAIKQVKREFPDMFLVMGSTGNNALEEFFVGSTTETIIKAVEVPTFVVPHTFKPTAYKDILVAIEDFDALQEKTKKELVFVSKLLDVKLELITIQTSQVEMEKVIEGITEPEVTEFIEGSEVTHEYLIADNVEQGIWEAAKREKTELLCVVHHTKGLIKDLFRKSVTSDMVKEDLLPILVLHEVE